MHILVYYFRLLQRNVSVLFGRIGKLFVFENSQVLTYPFARAAWLDNIVNET